MVLDGKFLKTQERAFLGKAPTNLKKAQVK